jgi:hypothetical protein
LQIVALGVLLGNFIVKLEAKTSKKAIARITLFGGDGDVAVFGRGTGVFMTLTNLPAKMELLPAFASKPNIIQTVFAV